MALKGKAGKLLGDSMSQKQLQAQRRASIMNRKSMERTHSEDMLTATALRLESFVEGAITNVAHEITHMSMRSNN